MFSSSQSPYLQFLASYSQLQHFLVYLPETKQGVCFTDTGCNLKLTMHGVIVTFGSQLLKVVTRMTLSLENSPARHTEDYTLMCKLPFSRVNTSLPSLKIGSLLNEVVT